MNNIKQTKQVDPQDTTNVWDETTIEALNLFIESQCTIDEIYSVLDLTKKEIEHKYKIKDFEIYYKKKSLSGTAKIKARSFTKAMEGDSIMLRHLTPDVKNATPDLTVIELPNNGRVKSK